MCGRFALTATPDEIAALFGLGELEEFPPRYNIAPTQPILMVTAAPRAPRLQPAGPSRASGALGADPRLGQEPGELPLLFNARSETAAEKASFQAAMRHRRALVPASGFYEWKRSRQAVPALLGAAEGGGMSPSPP